jgi:hypothetical protein
MSCMHHRWRAWHRIAVAITPGATIGCGERAWRICNCAILQSYAIIVFIPAKSRSRYASPGGPQEVDLALFSRRGDRPLTARTARANFDGSSSTEIDVARDKISAGKGAQLGRDLRLIALHCLCDRPVNTVQQHRRLPCTSWIITSAGRLNFAVRLCRTRGTSRRSFLRRLRSASPA